MFIGREKELAELERLYAVGNFQMPVIYGRRRVGKTALIKEFAKNKRTMFFTALETNAGQNLDNLSKAIMEFVKDYGTAPVFRKFQEALEFVFSLAEKERFVLVIDEYPYLAESYKGFGSMLQAFIDTHRETSKLFIILCGSSMSFMESEVLGYKSPLYGRRTAQFKILPFDFFECRRFFKGFSGEDMATIYSITGGTPQYVLMMDGRLTVEENIKNNFLIPSSYLFEEPNNLLKQEVREPAIYNAIITAIAGGHTKMSEISSKTGEGTSVCSAYLKNLISLGIVKKETPVVGGMAKKTIYALADNMFRFWYRFIPSNISMIHNGMADAAYRNISDQLPSFVGTVFEDICKEYLWHLNRNGETPFTFTDAGKWWGGDPVTKSETEIDIIATDNKGSAIFCECKWTKDKADASVIETLLKRSELFSFVDNHFFVFSKNGFTSKCAECAAVVGNTRLIGFEEMMRAVK